MGALAEARIRNLLARRSFDKGPPMTTNPMTAEEAVETIARAICDIEWDGSQKWDRKPEVFKSRYRAYARAALAVRLSEPSGELVEAMRTGAAHLEAAAVQFELYEGQHRGKHTADGDAKAAVNSQWAARLRTEVTIARAAILSAEGWAK